MKLKLVKTEETKSASESYGQQVARENQDVKRTLSVARDAANLWADLIATGSDNKTLTQIEDLIADAAFSGWGMGTRVEIDRERGTAFARHVRGLSMNLVTGEII